MSGNLPIRSPERSAFFFLLRFWATLVLRRFWYRINIGVSLRFLFIGRRCWNQSGAFCRGHNIVGTRIDIFVYVFFTFRCKLFIFFFSRFHKIPSLSRRIVSPESGKLTGRNQRRFSEEVFIFLTWGRRFRIIKGRKWRFSTVQPSHGGNKNQ